MNEIGLSPPITVLLNGQVMKVSLGSTSVTWISGAMRRRNRAAVAPPKPPPMIATRPRACASAGAANGPSPAMMAPRPMPLTTSLRVVRRVMSILPRARQPAPLLRRDEFHQAVDFRVAEALGDAVH